MCSIPHLLLFGCLISSAFSVPTMYQIAAPIVELVQGPIAGFRVSLVSAEGEHLPAGGEMGVACLEYSDNPGFSPSYKVNLTSFDGFVISSVKVGETYHFRATWMLGDDLGTVSTVSTKTAAGPPGSMNPPMLSYGYGEPNKLRVMYNPPAHCGDGSVDRLAMTYDLFIFGENYFAEMKSFQNGGFTKELTAGLAYSFRVRAVNEISPGPLSEEVKFTVLSLPPMSTPPLVEAVENGQVRVFVHEPSSSSSQTGFPPWGFQLRTKLEMLNEQFATLWSVESFASGSIISLPPEGNKFYLRCAAVNQIGVGPFSDLSTIVRMQQQQQQPPSVHEQQQQQQQPEAEEVPALSLLPPDMIMSDMSKRIGGVGEQLRTIYRRVILPRLLSLTDRGKLGVLPAKGLLLYGPPGTGKTLLASELARIMRVANTTFINGPDIMSKYLGESEENLRRAFDLAERAWREKGDRSPLYMIVFDEIDAVCRKRGSKRDSAGIVYDSIVNALLTKMDGTNSAQNVLIVAMTNRRELLDPALLRSGRFDVQIEMKAPNITGRVEILQIHTRNLTESSLISAEVRLDKIAEMTNDFTGADIAALVRSAVSSALDRAVDELHLGHMIDASKTVITMADFEKAVKEIKDTVGVNAVTSETENLLKEYQPGGVVDFSAAFRMLNETIFDWTNQIVDSEDEGSAIMSLLLVGPKGSGKTAMAVQPLRNKSILSARVVSFTEFDGGDGDKKYERILDAFDSVCVRSPALIVLDNLERLIEYSAAGHRHTPALVEMIITHLEKRPKKCRLLVIGTSSTLSGMQTVGLASEFGLTLSMQLLSEPEHIKSCICARTSINWQIDSTTITTECANGKKIPVEVISSFQVPLAVKPLMVLLDVLERQIIHQPVSISRMKQLMNIYDTKRTANGPIDAFSQKDFVVEALRLNRTITF